MTNTIPPLPAPPLPLGVPLGETPQLGGYGGKTAGPAANEAAQVQAGEAVTLSAGAQFGAQLLAAARAASGVDDAAVSRLSGALANDTYSVAPEDLAQAIATVLKETQT